MFVVLYVSFLGQIVYIIAFVNPIENKMVSIGLLSLEWLILITATAIAKKNSNPVAFHNNRNNNNRNNNPRPNNNAGNNPRR